jgi:hypothetical protein
MAGILYSAIGNRFFDEALTSARSSLRFNQIPHVIFTDQDGSSPDCEVEGLSIETYRPSGDPFVEKIRNMARSPFERSLFLDTDTYVTHHVRHIFQLLDKYDMAAAFAPGSRGAPDLEVPVAFYEFNTGVVGWRANQETAAFFTGWLEAYEELGDERPFTPLHGSGFEQPAFRRCAWRHAMRIAVLGPEYNYRTHMPGCVVAKVRIIHGRVPDFEEVAEVLNRDVNPRTFPPLAAGPTHT